MDTIHAIYFDALSNPLKQPCLSSFFPPSIPSPSLPSNRCSREKLFRYSLVSRILLLSRIRWTLFSRARKLRRGKREGPRRGSPRIPLSLKYSAFICSRWNSNDSERDEVYPANGVCGGRTSLKRTKLLEFIFALITRKIRGGGRIVIFPRGVYEHTRPDLVRAIVQIRRVHRHHAPPPFRLDKVNVNFF